MVQDNRPGQLFQRLLLKLIKNNLKLGSLHPTRDFTFIEDTTDAFLASIKSNKGIGEIVNVGSGFEISIKQLAHKIAKIMGNKIYIKKEP